MNKGIERSEKFPGMLFSTREYGYNSHIVFFKICDKIPKIMFVRLRNYSPILKPYTSFVIDSDRGKNPNFEYPE
jgi:hypothetical protein